MICTFLTRYILQNKASEEKQVQDSKYFLFGLDSEASCNRGLYEGYSNTKINQLSY